MITKISSKCTELVKHYESLHDGDLKKIGLQPKLCPANIVTIGYGRAIKDKKGNWLKGQEGLKQLNILYPELETITEQEACKMLEEDLGIFSKQIVKLCMTYGFDLNQNQFDAIVSFSYNCGVGAIVKGSKLLTVGRLLLNNNRSKKDAENAFNLWNKGGGKVLKGLVYRRNSETLLFNDNEIKFFN